MRELDDATLDEIIRVIVQRPLPRSVIREIVEPLENSICWIVKEVQAYRKEPARDRVIACLDGLIAALEPFADGGEAELVAPRIFLSTRKAERAHQQVADLIKALQQEREYRASPWGPWGQRRRGSPRGSRAPGLDMFLRLFLRHCAPYSDMLTAHKNRKDGSAQRRMAEIVRLVAPCFPKGFLPEDWTLFRAIDRAKREYARELADYAQDEYVADAAGEANEEAGWLGDDDWPPRDDC